MIFAVLWAAGGAFTIGFIDASVSTLGEAAFVMLVWPAVLGNDIRKKLSK